MPQIKDLFKLHEDEYARLVSSNARKDIELSIISRLIDDPDYELSGVDFDYETTLINKIDKLRKLNLVTL